MRSIARGLEDSISPSRRMLDVLGCFFVVATYSSTVGYGGWRVVYGTGKCPLLAVGIIYICTKSLVGLKGVILS